LPVTKQSKLEGFTGKGMEQSATIKSEQVAEPPKKISLFKKNETR